MLDEGQSQINKSLETCPWLTDYQLQHSALIERWKTGGFFQEQDFVDINCYWLQFEPAPLVNHLILICIFVFVLLIGCLSNAVAVYVLASSRHLRTPANVIIMNLAVSDFFMLIKMPIFLYNSLLQGPALGSRGCEVYGFLSGLTGTTSIMSLAAVAVDRYLVISHPLNINTKPTRTRAYVTAVLIWIYSAVFASLPLFGIGKYVPEGYLTSCSFDYLSGDEKTRIFILSFFVAAWLVPFLIISSCYAAIFWYVRKARIELERQQWSQQQINAQVVRNCTTGWRQCTVEMIIAKIVVGLVALWLISWTPYAFVALVGISGNQNRLTPGMTMLPALFAKLSACINPIVYTLSHPKIRKEMIRRWYCFMSGGTTAGDVASVYGGAVSPGQQGPMWRQQSSGSSSHQSGVYLKRHSSMSNNRKDPTVLVHQTTESSSGRRQLVSLVSITHHLRSQTSLAEQQTRIVKSRDADYDETCLSVSLEQPNGTYYHYSDDPGPNHCPTSELVTGSLMVMTVADEPENC